MSSSKVYIYPSLELEIFWPLVLLGCKVEAMQFVEHTERHPERNLATPSTADIQVLLYMQSLALFDDDIWNMVHNQLLELQPSLAFRVLESIPNCASAGLSPVASYPHSRQQASLSLLIIPILSIHDSTSSAQHAQG